MERLCLALQLSLKVRTRFLFVGNHRMISFRFQFISWARIDLSRFFLCGSEKGTHSVKESEANLTEKGRGLAMLEELEE